MRETSRELLTRKVKAEARRQGFSLTGVTTPDPPAHVDFFQEWIRAGYHGEMGWMASERSLNRRSDPREILPDCQSILALGFPYPFPAQVDGRGNISSYAWNQDYHQVLWKKLEKIVKFLEDQLGKPVSNRWYTDTGPILEREIASRAGLGWIGKNTTLINPRQGSFVFLAEILLGIPLKPDPPFSGEHCGTCTRCLDACPTGCLVEPYTLDANRCLSYLTIEHKGYLPEELRPLFDEWIFGCDICQQVCPWNQRFGHHTGVDQDLMPREGIPHPDLEEEIRLTPEEFRQKFSKNPVKRTKRRGYLRNVAVALGNRGIKSALPGLGQALKDQEPLIRGHAAWSLGEIGGQEAREMLAQAREDESDPQVLREIKRALKEA